MPCTSATTRSWSGPWRSRCRDTARRSSRSRSSCARPAAAQLRHPGIVTVYDVGVADGQCYIVSDFLQGVTLRKWLAEHPLTWQQAAQITADVADALAYAHSHSTLHRNVKPENIYDLRHEYMWTFEAVWDDGSHYREAIKVEHFHFLAIPEVHPPQPISLAPRSAKTCCRRP